MFILRLLLCCPHTSTVHPIGAEERNDSSSNLCEELPIIQKTKSAGLEISSLHSSSTCKDELELSSLSFRSEVKVKRITDKDGEASIVKILFEKGVQTKVIYNEGKITQEVHEGSFEKDLLHGEGTISWPFYLDSRNPGRPCQTYKGIFRHGKIISGLTSMVDGTTTSGFYNHEQVLTGEGSMTLPNGGGLYGYFEDGIFTKGKRVKGFNEGYEEGTFNELGALIQGKRVIGLDESYEEGRFNRYGKLIHGVRGFKDGTQALISEDISIGDFK